MRQKEFLFSFMLLSLLLSRAFATPVPNPSLESGDQKPAGWTLSGGAGKWVSDHASDGKRSIAVTGTGDDSNYWRSDTLPLKKSSVYRLDFDSCSTDGSGGTPVTGPVFCNHDLGHIGKDWTPFSSIFVTPREIKADEAWLRFGQWNVKGTVSFDNIRLTEVQPVYSQAADVVLGDGERLEGCSYTFSAPLNSQCSNHSRPLESEKCKFNSNRWTLDAGSDVIYRHRIGNRRQTGVTVEATVSYYGAGELVMDASRDGRDWRQLGSQGRKGLLKCVVPSDMLPAADIWIRLRAQAAAKAGHASMQVDNYQYNATVDGSPVDGTGKTLYVEVTGMDPDLDVVLDGLGAGIPGASNVVTASVLNRSQHKMKLIPSVSLVQGKRSEKNKGPSVVLAAGAGGRIECPYQIPSSGAWNVAVDLGRGSTYSCKFALDVPAFYETSYGDLLPASSRTMAVWWASSGWKIPRYRPAPDAKSKAILIRTARNEAEAAQLVLRPAGALRGLLIKTGPLAGPGGAVIPAELIEVLRVGYVPVRQITDNTGVVADWPDPLPPINAPLDLKAGENQPFWIRVKAPAGISAGLYKGTIKLQADGYSESVPLHVEVYAFDLPSRMTCESSFGFSPESVWRYQRIKSPEQRRVVLGKYLRNFGDHHISIYNPAPMDPFTVSWPSAGDWTGGVRDQEEKHGGKTSLILRDDDLKENVSAAYGKHISIPEKGLRLRFWFKTAQPGHKFIVTLCHVDVTGKWMSGRNNDMAVEGTGEWQLFDRTISKFAVGAKSVTLTLWATEWRDDGALKGTVWYDDVSLADAGTGLELVSGGDFEPLSPSNLKPVFQWEKWDRAVDKAFNEYHFNTLMIPLQYMGGGTFYSRAEPSLLGYGEKTPEYQAAFKAYAHGVQEHLREKGYLDKAYVYWFDEPDPKDYPFVMNGFNKLKDAAPDLRRMLTEQVEEGLTGGPNLWCPLTPEFANMEKVEARRKAGDHFWWYVCCGPKAPFCTEFIDHPATELRVWLWQTWQRQVEGILIWESTYWTSPAAYPDEKAPQNPYKDPMSWVSDYGAAAGTKSPWGNGDGRFLYPPEAAADGTQQAPVLDGPVDSLRWEMLRDGIEDYEYHVILKRMVEANRARLKADDLARYEALLKIPEAISTDLTHFTTDPAPVEKRRDEVARAIEALSGK